MLFRSGAWLAVDAAGLDDAPVGAAVDDVTLEAGHMFCVYTRSDSIVKSQDWRDIPNIIEYLDQSLVESSKCVLCIRCSETPTGPQSLSGSGLAGLFNQLGCQIFSKLTLGAVATIVAPGPESPDRKSTRLNSSHTDISRMPSSA